MNDQGPISEQSPEESLVNEEYKIDKAGINWRANWPGGRRWRSENDTDYEEWRAKKRIDREDFTKTNGEFRNDLLAAAAESGIDMKEAERLQTEAEDMMRSSTDRKASEVEFNAFTERVFRLLREKYGYEIIDLNS